MKNVFISGSVAYDEIMDFPHHFKDYFHPEKLHQINVSFVVSDLAKHLGGIATNISYALRNILDYYGNPKPKTLNPNQTLNSKESQNSIIKIYPVAAVGKDGGELLTFFKKNNIDTTYIQQDKKLYTATGKVITDKDDNQIWGFYYGASSLNPKLEIPNSKSTKKGDYSLDSRLRGNDIAKHSQFWVVAATHILPFSAALRYVIDNKLPYLFDPGMALTWIDDALLKKGVMNAQYVIGNDYEISMIQKRLKMTVKEIAKSGVNVITTLGEKGVNYLGVADSVSRFQSRQYSPSRKGIRAVGSPSSTATCSAITIPSFRVKKVVDPTGAGDAWRGGFVGALVAGKSLKECLIIGNVMASFAVESVGTVEYKPTKEEIGRRIKTLNTKL